MSRYHIDKNGNPAVCRATVKACPLGGSDGTQNHFDTKEEAQRFADEQNEREFGLVSKIKTPMTNEQVIKATKQAKDDHPVMLDGKAPIVEQLKNQGIEITDPQTISDFNKLDRLSKETKENLKSETIDFQQAYQIKEGVRNAVAERVAILKHNESGFNKVEPKANCKKPMDEQGITVAIEREKRAYQVTFDGTPVVDQLKKQGLRITDEKTIGDLKELDKANQDLKQLYQTRQISEQQFHQFQEASKSIIAANIATLKHKEDGFFQM